MVMRALCFFCCLLLLSTRAGLAATPAVLGDVIVNRQNIFDEPPQALYRLANRLHRVTREGVILRELWLAPGDRITADDAQELERNLRALDIFARVRVSLEPHASEPGVANLVIDTADRLSIVASAGGSFLGGIGEVEFSVGDNNLFGLGHRLEFGYAENTEGELLGSVAYDNVLVASNDIYAGVSLGQTEEGDFAVATLTNRFLNFDDQRFWRIRVERETQRDDFFDAGESVAEVPRTDERIDLQWQQRIGVPTRFFRVGPVARFSRTAFEAPIGPQAAAITRPEDDSTVFAGAVFAVDSNRAFQRITGLDTLRFEQDVALGYSAQVLAGLENRRTDTQDTTLPSLFLRGRTTNAVSAHAFVNAAATASFSVDDDELSRWSLVAASTLFNTRLDNQTFAARLRYASAFDRDGLPPQQTLGETNGLRGYPAREFNGEQSLLVNLEHRWRTPLRLATLELGTVAFFDAGWVGDRGDSAWLETARTSAGGGVRIGSPQLLGSLIIRVDVAFPLADAADEFDPTVSLAVGQVFGFRP